MLEALQLTAAFFFTMTGAYGSDLQTMVIGGTIAVLLIYSGALALLLWVFHERKLVG